jgi:very-short-patch-repair endonuclease
VHSNKTPDVRVANLATNQHRVAAYWQLRRCGLSAAAIRHRVSNGRLHPMHEGVYAVGHRDVGRKGFLMAAVLACGKGAALSHRTGADHRGLIRTSSAAIHVTVPSRYKPKLRGVIVHLTRQMTDADWTIVDGIPVTSVPRTLLDLAPLVSPRELVKALEQAERLRLFDMHAFEELLGRSRGRRGAKALRAALAELYAQAPDTKSPLEDRFFDFCRERCIELPQLNVVIADFCVDAAWPSKGVVVELDSRAHHTGIDAFEEDRKRDAKLQVAGHRIVRVTDHRLADDPDELEADIRCLLASG